MPYFRPRVDFDVPLMKQHRVLSHVSPKARVYLYLGRYLMCMLKEEPMHDESKSDLEPYIIMILNIQLSLIHIVNVYYLTIAILLMFTSWLPFERLLSTCCNEQ